MEDNKYSNIQWSMILLSTLGWFVLSFITRWISRTVFYPVYSKLDDEKQRTWDTRAVSFTHSSLIVFLAYPIMVDPVVLADRVFAYSPYASKVFAFSCGYFLWDIGISIRFMKHFGIGGLVHGVLCFFVYAGVQLPFLTYYGAVFLLFELSTPFLHMNWFLDKSGMLGTTVHKINAVALLLTFFGARVVFGFYSSAQFFYSVYVVEGHRIPFVLASFYSVANVMLNLLNLYWFSLMLRQFKRRTTPGAATNGTHKPTTKVYKKVD